MSFWEWGAGNGRTVAGKLAAQAQKKGYALKILALSFICNGGKSASGRGRKKKVEGRGGEFKPKN